MAGYSRLILTLQNQSKNVGRQPLLIGLVSARRRGRFFGILIFDKTGIKEYCFQQSLFMAPSKAI
jgi:hypothetical protein